MSSWPAAGLSTPHKPEPSSDRAHFPAVTAVLKPLQPGRHALVVGESLGRPARVAGEQQCEQGAGANTTGRHPNQHRGQNEAGCFLAAVAQHRAQYTHIPQRPDSNSARRHVEQLAGGRDNSDKDLLYQVSGL
jgi:hypothetical protein